MGNIVKALQVFLIVSSWFFASLPASAADDLPTPDTCFSHILQSNSNTVKIYYKMGYSHGLQDASIHTNMSITAPILEDNLANSFQIDACVRGDIVQAKVYKNLMRILFSGGSFLIFHGFCIAVTFLFRMGL
jgi:hypothetical protein